MVEAISIGALLKIKNASALKEKNYNGNLIIKVLRHIRKTALIERSILITKKGDKEGRSTAPIV